MSSAGVCWILWFCCECADDYGQLKSEEEARKSEEEARIAREKAEEEARIAREKAEEERRLQQVQVDATFKTHFHFCFFTIFHLSECNRDST